MNFYYRSLSDGRCEVVCIHCFLTVGTARDIEHIRRVENSHTCLVKRRSAPGFTPGASVGSPVAVSISMPSPAVRKPSISHVARIVVLLCLVAALLYVLPKFFEFHAMHRWNPWISVVLPGDLAGCLCLAIVFRKIKAAILLYCLLTSAEALLYWLHIAPADVLPWVADLVPTVVISLMVVESASRAGKLLSLS